MIIFCPYCGHENTKNNNNCNKCDKQILTSCLDCGSIVPSNIEYKFCLECGSKLGYSSSNKGKNKVTKKDMVIMQYGHQLEQIKELISKSLTFVSYQYLAEKIGLTGCYEKINPTDEKSTVGYLIYLAKIRDLGYKTITYQVKFQDKISNDSKNLIMRYIGKVGINDEINEKDIVEETIKAYPQVDFAKFQFASINIK